MTLVSSTLALMSVTMSNEATISRPPRSSFGFGRLAVRWDRP
jgi:hypothetical protein